MRTLAVNLKMLVGNRRRAQSDAPYLVVALRLPPYVGLVSLPSLLFVILLDFRSGGRLGPDPVEGAGVLPEII